MLVGKIFETNSYGKLEVIKYNNAKEVYVRFLDTGYETITQAQQIVLGKVKDRLLPSIFGVGVIGEYSISVKRKPIKEYDLWRGMLERCYDDKRQTRYPTYRGCTVSENFKYFTYFKEWCNRQIGFGLEGWCLDKDLLVKGNKVYSEDTCCFVPQEINLSVVTRKDYRGEYPVGVGYKPLRNQYRARCNKFGKNVHLGWFSTVEDAFRAYKVAKEQYLKELANKWKDQIDPRVYEALMKYEVEITD